MIVPVVLLRGGNHNSNDGREAPGNPGNGSYSGAYIREGIEMRKSSSFAALIFIVILGIGGEVWRSRQDLYQESGRSSFEGYEHAL